MLDFRDIVNANRPKPNLQYEINTEKMEIIKRDVDNAAELIRERILDAARNSTTNVLSYKGVLLRPEVTFFNTREVIGPIKGEAGTWLKYIDLGVCSTMFLSLLKNNLAEDDIEISDWKIATYICGDTGYFDSIRSMSEKWFYHYATEETGALNFKFVSEPISFDGTVKITYDRKYKRIVWRYNGRKYWAGYSWGKYNYSKPCICAQVSFHN